MRKNSFLLILLSLLFVSCSKQIVENKFTLKISSEILKNAQEVEASTENIQNEERFLYVKATIIPLSDFLEPYEMNFTPKIIPTEEYPNGEIEEIIISDLQKGKYKLEVNIAFTEDDFNAELFNYYGESDGSFYVIPGRTETVKIKLSQIQQETPDPEPEPEPDPEPEPEPEDPIEDFIFTFTEEGSSATLGKCSDGYWYLTKKGNTSEYENIVVITSGDNLGAYSYNNGIFVKEESLDSEAAIQSIMQKMETIDGGEYSNGAEISYPDLDSFVTEYKNLEDGYNIVYDYYATSDYGLFDPNWQFHIFKKAEDIEVNIDDRIERHLRIIDKRSDNEFIDLTWNDFSTEDTYQCEWSSSNSELVWVCENGVSIECPFTDEDITNKSPGVEGYIITNSSPTITESTTVVISVFYPFEKNALTINVTIVVP